MESLSHLRVPVGEGMGLMKWAMLSGMLIVRGDIWGWTGFTGDSGTFLGSFFSAERAVKVILMLVLGKRKQHLRTQTSMQRLGGGMRNKLWFLTAYLPPRPGAD